MTKKPTALVLQGLEPGHRELVRWLVQKDLCSEVRVIDKTIPALANLSPEDTEVFKKVDFVQANIVNPSVWPRAFTRSADSDDETRGSHWNYVFCCQLTQKPGQIEEIYQSITYDMAIEAAKEFLKHKCDLFIYLNLLGLSYSSQSPYSAAGSMATEESVIRQHAYPFLRYQAKADLALQQMEGLNLLILRSVLPWGPDSIGDMARVLTMGRVYKELGEPLFSLYAENMACHTIHMDDVVGATWQATQWYGDKEKSGTVIFNLVDQGKTTHGDILRAVGKVFDIPIQVLGPIKLKMYHIALKMEMVRDEVNEKHMKPWAKLLEDSGIQNSPLSPYIDESYLQFEEVSVDGSKLVRETGYQYTCSGVTVDGLKAQVASYQRAGIWPKDPPCEEDES